MSDSETPALTWEERALNAEDLLAQIRAYSSHPNITLPPFLVGGIDELVPDWAQRQSRTEHRRAQAEALAAGATTVSDGDRLDRMTRELLDEALEVIGDLPEDAPTISGFDREAWLAGARAVLNENQRRRRQAS